MTNWKWTNNPTKEPQYVEETSFGILSGSNIVDEILNEQSYIIWKEWLDGMTLLDRVKVWGK